MSPRGGRLVLFLSEEFPTRCCPQAGSATALPAGFGSTAMAPGGSIPPERISSCFDTGRDFYLPGQGRCAHRLTRLPLLATLPALMFVSGFVRFSCGWV